IGTAIKFGRAAEAVVAEAATSMRKLNKDAAEALAPLALQACTDVTGFGLLGHASEMAAASDVSLEIEAEAVPLLGGVLPLVDGNKSGGLSSNRAHFASGVVALSPLAESRLDIFYDPQTSGGLLVAVPEALVAQATAALDSRGVFWARVGRATPRGEGLVTVR
ncbi:MAG: AIR synthase-related protein, partial [Acidobacteriota bacterium]